MDFMRSVRFACAMFCVVVVITSLGATNFYVSNTGSNANSGLTEQDAFLTLQYAANQVGAGDTVFVLNGTYSGFDLRNVDGTGSQPIVFIALGDSVLIDQSGPIRSDGINIENADHIIVDGFIVNDMTGNGNGIRVVLSDHCVVRNCRCDNNAERGIFTGFTDDIVIEHNVCTNSIDEHGIYVSNSSDRPIIRFNECYGNNNIGIHLNGDLSAGGDGIISDAQIYGNIIHDNGLAAGINMDGVEDPIVYNNLIYNNHFAQGIAMFQQDGAIPTQGARIYNNTIIVPSDGRWGIHLDIGSNLGTEIFNNIIINEHPWRGCITVEDTAQFQSDYNIVNNKMSDAGDGQVITFAEWQALGLDQNSQLANGLTEIFIDPSGGNYMLADSSQAIDAGTAFVIPPVDVDLVGITRPQGGAFDIGAFEHPCEACWQGGAIVYVDSSATGTNNGYSWADAFTDLQAAITACAEYEEITEIWVASGTYLTTPLNDRMVSFLLSDSIKIYGGFSGGESGLDQRDPMINRVRLSGDIGIAGLAADNAYRVVVIDTSCTGCLLDGLVITGGNANGAGPSNNSGSGIYVNGLVEVGRLVLRDNLPGARAIYSGPGGVIRVMESVRIEE